MNFVFALVVKEKLLGGEVIWKWITGSVIMNFKILLGAILEAERTRKEIEDKPTDHENTKDRTSTQTPWQRHRIMHIQGKRNTDRRMDYRNQRNICGSKKWRQIFPT